MTAIDQSDPGFETRKSQRSEFIRALLKSRKAMFGLVIVALIIIAAAFSPWLAPNDPDAQTLAARLAAPFTTVNGHFHLLGTDQLGRDILSRLIYGARISLLIGLTASLLAGVLGITLGLVAGYTGGRTD